ncbi:hypothetical protein BDV93DRAFT_521011 [Ceratobasidium sp. AG-I]|nr:hypothetical protein BDV93DRAFT_521011 [Ceratobasidium sp. AG-I]
MAALVDSLPPEILSQIFVTLVRSSLYTTSVSNESYNAIDYPVRLSSVCVRWRQVAINSPLLWSFLDLFRSDNLLHNFEYLNMLYERSANAPLSVRLGKYNTMCYQETVDERLAPLLSSYATRLYSIAICYYHPMFAKEVLSRLLVPSAVGRVRKLALRAYREGDIISADSSLPQSILNKVLESLYSLHLDCIAFEWNNICCRNLVELQLIRLHGAARPSTHQLASFLNTNPAIRRLRISNFKLSTYGTSLPPIQLPELQNLELDVNIGFALWFFTLLAPGTRDITLITHAYAPAPDIDQVTDAFCQFFQRSRIVTLRIQGGCYLPFASIAAYLPHLETLGTFRPTRGYHLSDVDTQSVLLPKLHTVELVECSTRDVESGLGTILSLPSVKHILFQNFRSVESGYVASMNVDEVKQWMRVQGITANLRIAPELLFRCSPTPFL